MNINNYFFLVLILFSVLGLLYITIRFAKRKFEKAGDTLMSDSLKLVFNESDLELMIRQGIYNSFSGSDGNLTLNEIVHYFRKTFKYTDTKKWEFGGVLPEENSHDMKRISESLNNLVQDNILIVDVSKIPGVLPVYKIS